MKKNKIKELVKEHKMDILRGVGACAGTFGVCSVIYGVGYAVGYRDSARAISKGIDKMWEANPELKNLMWDALGKIKN